MIWVKAFKGSCLAVCVIRKNQNTITIFKIENRDVLCYIFTNIKKKLLYGS